MQLTLADIKVTLTLEQLFNFQSQKHFPHLTMNEAWVAENNLRAIPGINELVHFQEVVSSRESALATITEIHKLEDWNKRRIVKEQTQAQESIKQAIVETEAKARHEIIKEWKKTALFTVMKVCKVDNAKANDIINRAMNPTTANEKKFAVQLDYPYREENIVIDSADNNNNNTEHKAFDPRKI